MSKKIKMILATDLDGTFLSSDSRETNIELYRIIKEHREEIILIYATGRGYESVLPLLDDSSLPQPDYIIADVGATILKRSQDVYASVVTLQSGIAEIWPGREVILNELAHIDGLQLQEVPQERRCSFYYSNSEVLPAIEKIGQMLGLTVLTSAGKYLDFLPRGVSKGQSLKQLMELENLSSDKVLVAGDTLNDLSMMMAGYKGVVVGNGEQALKMAVNSNNSIYISKECGPFGILEAIYHHGFSDLLGINEVSNEACYGTSDLVMVYHRQPFEEVKRGKSYSRQQPKSPNGIIPTLLGFFAKGEKGAWIAWSQQESRNPDKFETYVDVDKGKYPNLIAARIALTSHDVNLFYKRFSKESFWPIIFSFPDRATFIEEHWKHFCEINRLFAERTAEVSALGATVWIHDYNLWMTPAYLRDLRPDLKIAFFHHTAFPGADVFNIIPWRRDIVASLLKCDYVGFHIPRYVENFVDVVRSNSPVQILTKEACAPTFLTFGCALGVEEMSRKIKTPYGIMGVGAHPVGIDNSKIENVIADEQTQARVYNLRSESKGRKLLLSVERLDYVKGPIEKMLAFESFLESHPEWHDKITMINIVTPPAPGMEIYKSTREKLDQVVGRINGRFSKMGWTPVRYFYRAVPFDELISYYVASDVAWITPLRDGLNLVCKEYVSAKSASSTLGVLILSEFAGAAVEMKGAVLTNPYDNRSMIQGLEMALTLDDKEIQFRMNDLIQRVKDYDVNAWGEDFLKFSKI